MQAAKHQCFSPAQNMSLAQVMLCLALSMEFLCMEESLSQQFAALGVGWPSFFEKIAENVEEVPDYSIPFYPRTEVPFPGPCQCRTHWLQATTQISYIILHRCAANSVKATSDMSSLMGPGQQASLESIYAGVACRPNKVPTCACVQAYATA